MWIGQETRLTLIQSFYFRMFCVNSETFLTRELVPSV